MTFPCLFMDCGLFSTVPYSLTICLLMEDLFICMPDHKVFNNAQMEGDSEGFPSPSQDVGDDDHDGWKCSVGSRQWRRWSVRGRASLSLRWNLNAPLPPPPPPPPPLPPPSPLPPPPSSCSFSFLYFPLYFSFTDILPSQIIFQFEFTFGIS